MDYVIKGKQLAMQYIPAKFKNTKKKNKPQSQLVDMGILLAEAST